MFPNVNHKFLGPNKNFGITDMTTQTSISYRQRKEIKKRNDPFFSCLPALLNHLFGPETHDCSSHLRFNRKTLLSYVTLLWGLCAFGISPVQASQEVIGHAIKSVGEFTVLRTDGILEQLEGQETLALFEGDILQTAKNSLALLEFSNGIQIVLNQDTNFLILSRWESEKGLTRILRLYHGEVWVNTRGGPKSLEIETPVATAAVKQTEFDIQVLPDGQTTLTVIEGTVDFGSALGTWAVTPSTVSYGNRGKKCTKPAPIDVGPHVKWTQGIR